MHDFRLSSYIHHRTEHLTTSYRFFASVIILISTVEFEFLYPSFGRISLRLQLAICRLIMETPRPILCAHGGILHEAE
jgi:hypothetical protein